MNAEQKKQQKSLKQYLELLPEHVRKVGIKDPERLKAAIDIELRNRKKYYPSIDFVPNIAQERALKCLAAPHENYNDYPKQIMFCAANGIGKTCCIAAILLPGVCLGPEFVNKQYCNWQYFHDIKKLKRKRKLLVRLVCDAKDMKEDAGSLHQQIKKWIPTAKFKDKTGDFYQTVIIGDVTIDVKTHSMDIVSHAGPDYDLVIFNEPAPKSIYEENISRLRNGGRAALFLTPLSGASYLRDDIVHPEGPEGEVYFTEGNVWENCEDIEGTRGILKRRDIEFQIRKWKRLGTGIYQARAFGKFTAFAGVIFPLFNTAHHVIDPFEIPRNWNFYMLLDPHEVKEPFVMWIAKSPMNQTFIVAEYPYMPWDQIDITTGRIKSFCADFDFIESGRHSTYSYMPKNVQYRRIGDPNRMNVKYPNSGLTINQSYAEYGYDFEVDANDDVTLGHDRIRDMIYYDIEQEITPTNQTKLFVFRTCKNVQAAFMDYKVNDKGRIDPTWKCPIDLLRYYCDKQDEWTNTIGGYGEHTNDDYDEIVAGRNPNRYAASAVMEDRF